MVKDKEKEVAKKRSTANLMLARENLVRLVECTRQLEKYNAKMREMIQENKNSQPGRVA